MRDISSTLVTTRLAALTALLLLVAAPLLSCRQGTSSSYPEYTPRPTCSEWNILSGCYKPLQSYTLPTMPTPPTPKYPGCEGWDCRKIEISVVYAIESELGRRSLVVEAFDNPYFAGSPGNSAVPVPFIASFTNTTTVSMWLKPGRWWFRAWLADDQPVAPLTYRNLQLVRDIPVGVAGALSGATAVDIQKNGGAIPGERYGNGNLNPPLLLVISHILVDPDSPGTAAYLRLTVDVAGCGTASENECSNRILPDRDIIIRLLDSPDLAETPIREFKVSSNLLLVSGSVGKLEWFSPELMTGRYFVAAAVDADADGYFDDEELVGITQIRDVPVYVDIKENYTRSAAIVLSRKTTSSQ